MIEHSSSSVAPTSPKSLTQKKKFEIAYPSPWRNNRRRYKTRFDSTTCSTEHFTSLQFIVVTPQDESGQNHAKGENEAKTNDYSIPDTLVKRRFEISHDVLKRYTLYHLIGDVWKVWNRGKKDQGHVLNQRRADIVDKCSSPVKKEIAPWSIANCHLLKLCLTILWAIPGKTNKLGHLLCPYFPCGKRREMVLDRLASNMLGCILEARHW